MRRWMRPSSASRASTSERTRSAARANTTRFRCLAASMPSAIARCVLPVPMGPASRTFSPRSSQAPRASSATWVASMPSAAAKSNGRASSSRGSARRAVAAHGGVVPRSDLDGERPRAGSPRASSAPRALAGERLEAARWAGHLELPCAAHKVADHRAAAHCAPPRSRRSRRRYRGDLDGRELDGTSRGTAAAQLAVAPRAGVAAGRERSAHALATRRRRDPRSRAAPARRASPPAWARAGRRGAASGIERLAERGDQLVGDLPQRGGLRASSGK